MKQFAKRIIRFFRPVYWPLVKVYFVFLSPETRGVRVVLTHINEILFVKNSYGLKYNFPGGNLSKHEDAKAGAMREIKEELGIEVNDSIFLGEIVPPLEYEYRKNIISVFTAELPYKNLSTNSIEITETKWCLPEGLPSMGHVAYQILGLYDSSNISL